MEITTTKIVQVVNPTQKKLDEIYEIAQRSARVRNRVWQQYGSLLGLSKLDYPRSVRDEWIRNREDNSYGLQARQWKMAFDEAFSNIKTIWSDAKKKTRQSIYKTRVLTEQEKHYARYLLRANVLLYKAIVGEKFSLPDRFKGSEIDRKKVYKFLSSRLRRHKGNKPIQNGSRTFSLDAWMYDLREDEQGRLWLGIMSLVPRERMHLLLTSPKRFGGNIRIVLKGRLVEVHYTEKEECPEPRAEPQQIIGVDKGFTEVLTDSNGQIYGDEFGEMLKIESDRLSEKNKKRNKIRSVAQKAEVKGNIAKSSRIRRNNFGRKKYDRQKHKARKIIRTYIGQAVHQLIETNHPDMVIGENLNFSYNGKKKLPRKVRRYFSSWLKGQLQDIITMRCQRSGAAFAPVNAAYTSQVCSWCGCFGTRSGDIFHCPNCSREANANYNAARNTLQRYNDPDIGLFTPFREVKRILEERFRTGETVHPGLETPLNVVNPRANSRLCAVLST